LHCSLNRLKINYPKILLAALIVTAILGVLLLPISPLPWYDEVDFASISRSYAATGKFICSANQLYFNSPSTEVLYYGPVYFFLNALVIKAIGFGIVQMRCLNFLAGIACIPMFLTLFRRLTNHAMGRNSMFIFAILMLADYTFFQDMHSGRMDLLALMFLLGGLIIVKPNASLIRFLLSGALIGVALLTTPRVFTLCIPYYCVLIWSQVSARTFYRLGYVASAVMSCVFIYGLWVALKFGSLDAFAAYLGQPTGVFASSTSDFFTPLFPMAWYQVVIVVGVGVTIAMQRRNLTDEHLPAIVVLLSTAIIFACVSGGSPVYFSLVVGFLYLSAIAADGSGTNSHYALRGLALFDFLFLLFKAGIVLTDFENRNPAELNQWLAGRLEEGDKVVADDRFYYAVTKTGADFQYSMRGGEVNERVKYQAERWNAKYLLVTDTADENFKSYARFSRLAFVDEFRTVEKRAPLLDNYNTGYQCFLFRFAR
jgi:Dolichyl-phosphate-mannose-protein mannosyltransferase